MRKILGVSLLLLFFQIPVYAMEKVVLQLRWEHQFQFAGFYASQWEGFYRDEGLEVEIRSAVKPDGKVMSSAKEVATGRAHFGVGGPEILLGRDRGLPLVVLAVLAQQSPVVVLARQELNLKNPSDLAGLRVRRVPSDSGDAQFLAMLKAAKIDISQLRHSSMPYYNISIYEEMAKGELDAVVTYSFTGLWSAKAKGLDITTMRPASYGVDFYGDSIFTVENLVRDHPKLVERFLRATLKGWRYALDHPNRIADRISLDLPRFYPPTGPKRREFNRFQIQEVTRLSHYPVIQIGHINPDRWQRMHQTLKEAGLVSGQLDIDKFIYDPIRQQQKFQVFILWLFIGVLGLSLFSAVAWRYISLLKVNRNLKQEIITREKAEKALQQLNDNLEIMVENRTEALTKAQEENIKQERLATLGKLTATVSHELRNPLGVITNSISTLHNRLKENGNGLSKIMDRIQRSARRCSNIIEDMLEFVRTQAPSLETMEFDPWLRGIISDYEVPASIEVSINLLTGGAMVRMDAERFQRAVINLLDNACQAVESVEGNNKGTRQLIVSTKMESDKLIVEIEDSGPGLTREVMEHIYEPLFSTKSFGVGLGLSIVRQIIESHNGTISLSNRENQAGVKATLEIPYVSSLIK